MKKLIVANWKMNPASQRDAEYLFGLVKKGVAELKEVQVVICPPFVFLPFLKGLILGAQNVFYKESGAFTGEISPSQLIDLEVEYVIVGHSEARKYLNESDELINKKIKECLKEKLIPILCVGENTGEEKSVVLEKQITEGLKDVYHEHAKKVVVAYEPVWAIGTGKNCSIKETVSSISLIKKVISNLYSSEVADNVRILYGGSVNSENSCFYIKETGVNGLLVGGASLDAQEFIKIVKSAI